MKVSDELIEKYVTYEENYDRAIKAAQGIKYRMIGELNVEAGEDFAMIRKIDKRAQHGQEVLGFFMMTMILLGVPLLCISLVEDRSTLNWPMFRVFVPFGLVTFCLWVYTGYQAITLNRRIKKARKERKKKGEVIHGQNSVDV